MEQHHSILVETPTLAIAADEDGNLTAVLDGGDMTWLAFYDSRGTLVFAEVWLLHGIQN